MTFSETSNRAGTRRSRRLHKIQWGQAFPSTRKKRQKQHMEHGWLPPTSLFVPKKRKKMADSRAPQKGADRMDAYDKQLDYCKGGRKLWVSPFSPERIDPLVAKDGKTIEFPTLSELRAVIPPHCFERSLFWSMFFVVRDILQGILVWYMFRHVFELSTDPPEEGGILSWMIWRLAWNFYAFIMGFALGGLWVIGHECGHGAFSDYKFLNDFVGWILHSALLVPYFCWAYSHSIHHKRTNHMTEDEVFNPPSHEVVGLKCDRPGEYERVPGRQVLERVFGGGFVQFFANIMYGDAKIHEIVGDTPFFAGLIYFRVFFGWPLYLLGVPVVTKERKQSQWLDHYRPRSKLFPSKMYWKVVASDVGVVITLSILSYCTYWYGFRSVWMWYFGPYLSVNLFLVWTDPTVPMLDEGQWDWVKGALVSTIDRDLDPLTNSAIHNINTTHVCHHLFPEMPHYHAVEATAALRAYLKPKGLINHDPTNFGVALLYAAARCHFVHKTQGDGIQYYRSFMDVPKTKKA